MTQSIHPNWENNINEKTTKLVVGSMPPEFVITKNSDKMRIDYFYGSKYSHFWNICEEINNIKINDANDCINLIKSKNIGIIDIYKSCVRKDNNSADNNLVPKEFENITNVLYDYPNIEEIYCTSVYVKNKLIKILKENFKEKFIFDKNTRSGILKLKDLKDKKLICVYSPMQKVYYTYKDKAIYMDLYRDLFKD